MATTKNRKPNSLRAEALSVARLKWTYPGMQSYAPQEKIINTLFHKLYPNNTIVSEVLVKTSVLNHFYSTSIYAISALAKRITALNIDNDLQAGKIAVVDQIANLLSRKNYSFASKYCANHNPNAYPINDSLVRGYLAQVIAKGNLHGYTGKKTPLNARMKVDYPFYKEVYDAFMKQYHLTSLGYRKVDWYIWTALKCNLTNLSLFKLI